MVNAWESMEMYYVLSISNHREINLCKYPIAHLQKTFQLLRNKKLKVLECTTGRFCRDLTTEDRGKSHLFTLLILHFLFHLYIFLPGQKAFGFSESNNLLREIIDVRLLFLYPSIVILITYTKDNVLSACRYVFIQIILHYKKTF